MNKDELIKRLTEYELKFLAENFSENLLAECVNFFASGGFTVWGKGALEQKLRLNEFFGDDK